MKIQQELTRDGDDLILTLSTPAGKVLARREWKGAGKYVVGEKDTANGKYVLVAVPQRVGIDVKGGS